MDDDHLRQAQKEFVDDVLREAFDAPKPEDEWSPTSMQHEDCDITLTFPQIPVPSQRNDLRYSH